jgi:hypothetical protein
MMESAGFKAIVGDAKRTKNGDPRGIYFDGTPDTGFPGYLELKFGRSELRTTYQMRLEVYKSMIDEVPMTLRTTRPINAEFERWLEFWGVNIEKVTR